MKWHLTNQTDPRYSIYYIQETLQALTFSTSQDIGT
jgi:hypothetical protein